jgi:hypothetical protein
MTGAFRRVHYGVLPLFSRQTGDPGENTQGAPGQAGRGEPAESRGKEEEKLSCNTNIYRTQRQIKSFLCFFCLPLLQDSSLCIHTVIETIFVDWDSVVRIVNTQTQLVQGEEFI